VPVILDGKISL